MMKKFFVSMLGSMAAIWLSLIIFTILIIIIIASIGLKAVGGGDISGKSVLYIDLTGVIDERESKPSLTDLVTYESSSADDLTSILTSIRKAADDKEIKGVYINCGGSELGYASRSEVIEALADFRKSGKWVYAYADNFEQGDYYVATAADSVYLNPVGTLNVHGLASEVMFFKDILDKLGIDVTVLRVGSYKSAVEPFMRMSMSPESRHQTEVYLSQIWGDVANTIAANRGIADARSVDQWADSMAFTWAPERYVQQGAVSRLCYRSEVEDKIRELTDTDKDADLPTITPTEYMTLKRGDMEDLIDQDHIAVLYAVGEIYDTGKDGIVDDAIVPEIQRLANDKHVKGMVLRVNSPGGSAFASEQIWHALQDFKLTGKPLYVSMGDYAASGGYYISCCADRIYSDPATLTGSIGIFGLLPNAEKLIEDKIGLGIETVETSPNALFPSLFKAPTQGQKDAMQTYIERNYELFVSHVADGRGLSVDSVKTIGGGRVWDGISALKIGLVDQLGTLNNAVTDMASSLSLKSDEYVVYPKYSPSILETLLKKSQNNIEVNVGGISAEDAKEYVDCVKKVKDISPVQARMPYIKLK